jgi:hypothetical protein
LHGSRSEDTGDAASIANSAASEHEDYFSEPGGYRPSIAKGGTVDWNGKDFNSMDNPWGSNPLQNPWTGVSEKSGKDNWVTDGTFKVPPLREKSAR